MKTKIEVLNALIVDKDKITMYSGGYRAKMSKLQQKENQNRIQDRDNLIEAMKEAKQRYDHLVDDFYPLFHDEQRVLHVDMLKDLSDSELLGLARTIHVYITTLN